MTTRRILGILLLCLAALFGAAAISLVVEGQIGPAVVGLFFTLGALLAAVPLWRTSPSSKVAPTNRKAPHSIGFTNPPDFEVKKNEWQTGQRREAESYARTSDHSGRIPSSSGEPPAAVDDWSTPPAPLGPWRRSMDAGPKSPLAVRAAGEKAQIQGQIATAPADDWATPPIPLDIADIAASRAAGTHHQLPLAIRRLQLTRRVTPTPASEVIFSVVDIETTGLEPQTGGIVEASVVRVRGDGTLLDEFVSLVQTFGSTDEARAVHGIEDGELDGAPPWSEVWDALRERLEGTVVVAHNLDFEEKFLVALTDGLPKPAGGFVGLCTLSESRRHLYGKAFSLKSLHKTVSGGWRKDTHEALGDARAAADLLLWLIRESPQPMYVTGLAPGKVVENPTGFLGCFRSGSPYDRSALARFAQALPESGKLEQGSSSAHFYRLRLEELLSDGWLDAGEIEELIDILKSTHLPRSVVLQTHREIWESITSRGTSDAIADPLTCARQLGLDDEVERLRSVAVNVRAQPRLKGYRVAFAGFDPDTQSLEEWAVRQGVAAAKRVTATVRFTVMVDSANPAMIRSSERLGIPIISPLDARKKLEKELEEVAARLERDLAEREARIAERARYRAEQDAIWRHSWRPSELTLDPGPSAQW